MSGPITRNRATRLAAAAADVRAALDTMPYGAAANFDLRALNLGESGGDPAALVEAIAEQLRRLSGVLSRIEVARQAQDAELRQWRQVASAAREFAKLTGLGRVG